MKVGPILVWGRPVPQGSKIGRLVNGRVLVTDDNKKALHPWRKDVAAACTGRVAEPLDEPVIVRLSFWFELPASAPKTRRVLPMKKSTGDLDKLTRAVLDGLVDGKVLLDDSRVCGLVAAKDYLAAGNAPRCQIEVQTFDRDADGSLAWPEGWCPTL